MAVVVFQNYPQVVRYREVMAAIDQYYAGKQTLGYGLSEEEQRAVSDKLGYTDVPAMISGAGGYCGPIKVDRQCPPPISHRAALLVLMPLCCVTVDVSSYRKWLCRLWTVVPRSMTSRPWPQLLVPHMLE